MQVRVEALQTLNQNLPADFINSDHWPTMKHHLVDALDESNEQIMVNIIVYLMFFNRYNGELYSDCLID